MSVGRTSQGLRQVNGREEPLWKGTPSSRALSYIHAASAQLYDRCLSLNTGTTRPVGLFFAEASTPQTCSNMWRRGYMVWPRSFSG